MEETLFASKTYPCFKTIELDNTFSQDEITSAFAAIEKSGIECFAEDYALVFNFDEVDLRYLEGEAKNGNAIVQRLVAELHKNHSFSTSNGKLIYASFNKDRKAVGRKSNAKKRLAYEYYKKEFAAENNELPKGITNKIHCADSLEFLKKLPDNCIDIVLTSPPYNFGIGYASTNDVNLWRNYFDFLFVIFGECVRVLKNEGRIIVNVQPMFSDYIPTHHVISNFFMGAGLAWKGEIIWEKNNYNCKYCTWGSWQSPAAPYLKYSWEFIEVFCKNSLKKTGEKENIDITDEEFKKFVYAKWSIAPERNMKKFGHDAMFPEELVRRSLKLFSYKNDIVLDPFNGAGTTTKVAKELGRQFVGIDISESYCETARKRLAEATDLFNSQVADDGWRAENV